MPRLLSELICGTFLVYPSRDSGPEAQRIRQAAWALKADKIRDGGESWIEYSVRRLVESSIGSVLERFFEGAVLVPAPGSAKTLPSDRIRGPQLWTAKRICESLVARGLGEVVSPCVVRSETIESAKRSRAPRSPEKQIATLAVSTKVKLVPSGTPLVVVDDVLTSGSTILATASLALEAHGNRRVFGFAVFVTSPYLQGSPIQPRLHRITWDGKKCMCVELFEGDLPQSS